MLKEILIVGTGGFIGALVRYGLSGWVYRSTEQWAFPAGTLAVNMLGCLAIGAIMAGVQGRDAFSPEMRLFLVTGLLGSFTTFSTFGYETFELLRMEAPRQACLNIALSFFVGLGAVWVGWLLVDRW